MSLLGALGGGSEGRLRVSMGDSRYFEPGGRLVSQGGTGSRAEGAQDRAQRGHLMSGSWRGGCTGVWGTES